jgi:hypothetical protein
MQVVALVRPPGRPDEAARALAGATGLTMAEARMRLAPEPPAVLARLQTAAADELVAELRKAGLAVLAVDLPCPSDRDRTVVHRFALGDGWLTLEPRSGGTMQLPWTDVAAILRAARESRTDVERIEASTRYSTGPDGLPMPYGATTTVRSSTESMEQLIFLYARDGRSALLSAGELAFECLGPAMQPSSTGNVIELARLLREKARGAFHDERLVRLGRRPLPFVLDHESRAQSAMMVKTRSDTRNSLDVLAEVMWQALVSGLLP